jgi:hypothetical protein
MDDDILLETEVVHARALDREGDPRVALDVSELLLPEQMTRDDLVVVQADPHAAHLRAPVPVEGDEVRDPVRLEDRARGRRDHGHRPPF